MKYQFVTLVANEPKKPVRETFLEAWNDMYEYVKKMLDLGAIDYQLLETAIWIETDKTPIFFYDARDKAIDEFCWKPS